MFFSIYPETENVKDPIVSLVNHWGQVINLRGQILARRTPSVTMTPLRVSSQKRPRVYIQNVSVYAGNTRNMCACCRHTRGRFECTHGRVLNVHTGVFQFATPHTQPQPQRHTHTHNTTQHNITHNITRRQRQREPEKEKRREEKRRQEKRREEKRREEKRREEKRREEKRREKRRRQDKRREKREDSFPVWWCMAVLC